MAESYGALRYGGFRLLLLGTFCSTAAQWIQLVTLGWIVYDMTGSASLLGLIIGLRAVPMFVFAPIAGVIADRYSRVRVLRWSQYAQMLACLAITGVAATGAAQVWHYFVFQMVVSVGGVFDRTSRQTLIFDLLPREHAVSGVALVNVAFSVTRVLSPALGGFLLAQFGAAGNFLVQALAYAGAAASVAALRVPRHTAAHAQSGMDDLREGLRYAAGDRDTRLLLFIGVVPFVLLIPAFPALLPIFAASVFHTGPMGLGLMTTAIGVGGTLGALVTPMCACYDRLGRAQLAALVFFALAMIGVAASPSMRFAMPLLLVAGVMEITGFTLNQTMLQMAAPEHMRGRVTGLLQWNPAMISMASILVGFAADFIGAPAIVGITAGVALAIGILLAIGSPRLHSMRLSEYTRRETVIE